MPIIEYKYKCSSCGHEGIDDKFLKLSEVSDETKVRCSVCGLKNDGKRVWESVASVHYKGSGFFVNDYPKENKKK